MVQPAPLPDDESRGTPALFIAFEGRQVGIHTELPEVQAALAGRFRFMLVSDAALAEGGRLAVKKSNGRYSFRKNNGHELLYSTLSEILAAISYEIVVSQIKHHPHLVWLHAGAVARQGQVVLISGLAGQGKSTLVSRLYEQGWTYLADDVVALDPITDRALPFPQLPCVRQHPGRELPPEELRTLEKAVVEIDPASICKEPLPIQGLILPQYSPDVPAEMVPCTPAEAVLTLLENCANLPEQREKAVDYLCRLAERVHLYRLTFKDGDLAASLVMEKAESWSLIRNG